MKFSISVLMILCAVLISAVFMARREATIATAYSRTNPGSADVARSPVIVELFTSEGCSSCPPADALLRRLQKDQPVAGAKIIALSEHVDYWNYIGWADPFSSPAFSARQDAYAVAFGRENVYTPQMVIDGQAELIGSDSGKVQEAIAKAARALKADVRIVARPEVEKDSRTIRVKVSVKNVPAINQRDVAEVIFAITEDDLSSNVSRGENSGRKLAHAAVVREMRALGSVDPAIKAFDFETIAMVAEGWKRNDLRAVVFVQERARRRVLGAATTRLELK